MKRFMPLLSAGLLLLLALGCSQDSRPSDSGSRLLSRDQVRILTPQDFASKARDIDALGDFSLSLVPGSAAVVEGEGYRLSAPAGAVTQPVTIQANWLGDEAAPEIGFDFSPQGLEFAQPLSFQITLPLKPEDVPAGSELMVLYDREDGWYEEVSNEVHWRTVDDKAILDAPLEHFTKYLIGTGPPPDDDPGNN
jgi:hypothetical protein